MAHIHRLNEHLTNMIAAGEVVERPMGIVKECVENSIDAHAKRIEVHIQEGGLSLIRIIDDGDGMDFDDALMAFERHATSKIKKDIDLWNIHTLGFRGEAIPSIASVSEVDLYTNDGKDTTQVSVHYGQMLVHKKQATPQGTQIDIRNLFQKTPARFKHLKTMQYEFSLIADVIQKFALAYPSISFELTHNEVTSFKTNGNGNLLEVIMQIYGRDIAKAAIPIQRQDDDYTLNGYAILPQYNRANKYHMLIYMNQRMIRSHKINKAIQDAYSAYLPSDRYPIVILNVTMDAQLIDVNVHPSKWEVRLSKEKQLENFVYASIFDALKNHFQVPEVKPVKEKVIVEAPTLDLSQSLPKQVVQVHQEIQESFLKENMAKYELSQESIQEIPVVEEQKEYEIPRQNKPIELSDSSISEKKQEEKEIQVEIKKEPVNPSFPELNVIGQFHNCYIIAQGEKGLYIIDQHAAQEKYHYEQLKKNLFEPCHLQPLLIPEVFKVKPIIILQLKEVNSLLSNMHFQLELFGEDSVLLREIPAWLKKEQVRDFMRDIFDFYEKNQEINVEKLRKAALASMACHSSIRFNRSLTMEEMKQVIEDLRECEQPFHCPHGRPTLICISDAQLEKDFYRGG